MNRFVLDLARRGVGLSVAEPGPADADRQSAAFAKLPPQPAATESGLDGPGDDGTAFGDGAQPPAVETQMPGPSSPTPGENPSPVAAPPPVAASSPAGPAVSAAPVIAARAEAAGAAPAPATLSSAAVSAAAPAPEASVPAPVAPSPVLPPTVVEAIAAPPAAGPLAGEQAGVPQPVAPEAPVPMRISIEPLAEAPAPIVLVPMPAPAPAPADVPASPLAPPVPAAASSPATVPSAAAEAPPSGDTRFARPSELEPRPSSEPLLHSTSSTTQADEQREPAQPRAFTELEQRTVPAAETEVAHAAPATPAPRIVVAPEPTAAVAPPAAPPPPAVPLPETRREPRLATAYPQVPPTPAAPRTEPVPIPAMAVPRTLLGDLAPTVVVEPPMPLRRSVNVRIGELEVRAHPQPAPPAAAHAARPSSVRGFDDHRAIRSHAGWDL